MKHLALFGLIAAVACGDGGNASPDGGVGNDAGPSVDADVDPAPRFERYAATIEVIENSAITGDATSYGYIAAGFAPAPFPTLHAEAAREGSCRLLLWENPRCEPACVDAACVATDTCEPYPSPQSAGTLTLAGLHTTAVLEPNALNGYFANVESDLFANGARITASAEGDDLGAFEISVDAPDVDNLAVQDAGTLDFPAFQPDANFEFRWAATDPSARVRLRMAADAAHGQPFAAVIECDAPDTGSLTIPAALLTEFIAPQHWSCGECPVESLTRYRHATMDLAGGQTLELRVGNTVQFFYWGYAGG